MKKKNLGFIWIILGVVPYILLLISELASIILLSVSIGVVEDSNKSSSLTISSLQLAISLPNSSISCVVVKVPTTKILSNPGIPYSSARSFLFLSLNAKG